MPHLWLRWLMLGMAVSVMGASQSLASQPPSSASGQPTMNRSSVSVPDWKGPGQGPIPSGEPSWQPFQPAGSSLPPAWTSRSSGGSAPPSWKPATPQGSGPTWRTP